MLSRFKSPLGMLSLAVVLTACGESAGGNIPRGDRASQGSRPSVSATIELGAARAIASAGRVTIAPTFDPREGATLAIETTAIARGVPFDVGKTLPDAAGADLRIDRLVAEEMFLSREEGVEQLWIFEHAPAGRGDLVIRVRATGQTYAGWSDEGHHFVDEATRAGWRYGNATWVDSLAGSYSVPVRFEDGELVLTVAEEILEASAYPAILDPLIAPESGLIESGVTVAGLDQERPQIAFGGTEWMIVWSDNRTGGAHDIFAARVDATGMIIDQPSFPVSQADGEQLEPAIAFNGLEYLVVWADNRGGDFDVYGRRMALNGAMLGGEMAIASGAGDQMAADVAARGSMWFVVWEDHATGVEHLAYARIAEGGLPLDDSDGREVKPGSEYQREPAIACGAEGTDCLVVWESGAEPELDIHAARLGDGEPQPLVIVAAAGSELAPDVAFDGINYMVAYLKETAIYQNRVPSMTGEPLGEALVDNFASAKAAPAIAFDGLRYLIVWADDRQSALEDIYGMRLEQSGDRVDAAARPMLAAIGRQTLPVLAFGDGQYLLVEEDLRGERRDIYATRVGSSGSTGTAIARSGIRRVSPEAAFDGHNYLVVLAKAYFRGLGAGNTTYISAVRVSPQGVVNAGDINGGRTISQGIYSAEAPDIAHNSITHQFLVVWAQHNGTDFDVYGARITDMSAGPPVYALLDLAPIPIAVGPGNQKSPAVAWSSIYNRYLVVFEDDTTWLRDVRGVRVAYNGVVLDPASFAISSWDYEQKMPDVASTGAGWQVVWMDGRCGVPECDDLYTASVSNTGFVGPNLVLMQRPNKQSAPRIAANGTTDYGVVWVDERAEAGNGDIYGRRISSSGTPLPPSAGIPLIGGALEQNAPALVRVGSTWLITYRQQAFEGAERFDLFGTRRGETLQSTVDAPFVISAGMFSEDEPAVAVENEGRALVLYHRYDEEQNVRAQRAFARLITFP